MLNWEARTGHDPAPFLDWSVPLPRYWAAGERSVAKVTTASDQGVLKLEGVIFDVVDTMACPWHPKSEMGPFSRKGIEELEIRETLAMAEVQDCPYDKTSQRSNTIDFAEYTAQDDPIAPKDRWEAAANVVKSHVQFKGPEADAICARSLSRCIPPYELLSLTRLFWRPVQTYAAYSLQRHRSPQDTKPSPRP